MTTLSVGARQVRVARLERVRERMGELGVDALLLSHGADLPWLTGYAAMPLERLTVLVLPREGHPVLLVPRLEAPRVAEAGDLFELRSWSEDEDPVAIASSVVGGGRPGDAPGCVGVSDRAWAASVLALQAAIPAARWVPASAVTAPVRAVKDAAELGVLRGAAEAADRVAAALLAGEIALVGRRERDVSEEIAARLIAEGHERVNFAIVGSGPNAASPHHEPGPRVIGHGETVVCDFGGVFPLEGDVGYCSDITRTVVTGEPATPVAEAWTALQAAQEAAVAAARAGVPAQDVDAVARRMLADAGLGHRFIHRTGHGIGIEEHEDPYLVEGNDAPLRIGNAFSVEPGVYVPGEFGMRLEDIVVIGEDGRSEPLNRAAHTLAVVEA